MSDDEQSFTPLSLATLDDIGEELRRRGKPFLLATYAEQRHSLDANLWIDYSDKIIAKGLACYLSDTITAEIAKDFRDWPDEEQA